MWKPRRETLPITRELGRTWPSVAATPARNHRRRRRRYRPALARSCTTTVIPHQPGAAPESLRTPQNATTTTTTRCHVAAPTGRTGPRTVPNLAELGPPREKERERKRETMWKSRGGVLRASYPHPFPFRFFSPFLPVCIPRDPSHDIHNDRDPFDTITHRDAEFYLLCRYLSRNAILSSTTRE